MKKKIATQTIAGIALLATAVIFAASLASCSNSLDTEEKSAVSASSTTSGTSSTTSGTSSDATNGKAVVKISLGDEIAEERTVLPVFSKANLTSIALYGKSSADEGTLSTSGSYLLASWDTFASLAADEGVILDADEEELSGTWTFLLTAVSCGSAMSAESDSITLSTTETNTVAFTLAVVSGETKGAVKVELADLEKKSIAAVKYNWSTSQSVSESTAAELPVSTNSLDSKSAVFEKSDVEAGNYFLTFYFYDSDNALVTNPYQTSVIVQAGALSYKKLTASSYYYSSDSNYEESFDSNSVELKTYKITYMFNNGATENDRYVKEFYPASVLPGEYSSTQDADTTFTGEAPEGKRFRGWNTSKDGSGTRYSPGDSMSLESDLYLYAQWAAYDEADKVWTISSADEFRAFFSYSENGAATYGSKDYPAKLLSDITDLTDWEAVSYSGTFDGNSKSLTYSLSSTSAKQASLFATLSGTVKDLTLTRLSISSSSYGEYVAGLASIASGAEISGVTLTDSSIKSTGQASYVGGLIAYAENNTATSGNLVTGTEESPVTVSGVNAEYVGGLVAYAENCTFGTEPSPDKVSFVTATGGGGTGNKGTGAFAGYIKNTSIVSPEVTYSCVSGLYAGGIAGYADAWPIGSADYAISNAKVKSNESYPIEGMYAGGIAGFSQAYISNPVVDTVSVSADSSGGYAAGIAGQTFGTITSTLASANVSSAVISGNGSSTLSYTYLGGVAGENRGTISGIKVDASTKISSTRTTMLYAGGIAAYNKYENWWGVIHPGKIDGTNSVEKFTLECGGGNYGYVIGKIESGDVSDDISNAYSESTAVSQATDTSTSTSASAVSSSSYVEITLTRTAKVTLTVTDASGGAAVYGGITTSSSEDVDVSETSSTVLAYTGKVDGASATVSAGYLTKGTYYIVLKTADDSWDLSEEGNSVTYTID